MTQSIAIVTGAAGDIGAAIAARLADDHDIVLLADIDAEAAAAVAFKLGPGNRFVAVQCDVTSETSIAELARR
ncbi:SDR family NAD(P)-dependent oxidoreductase, partial [Rhizobium brockwellii]